MSDPKAWSPTLQLPKTDFPMRANLAQREPEMVQFWQDHNIYQKALARRQQGPAFVMQDGPPYANGNIHLGHTLNKCLKDFIIKYKLMKGYRAPFIPGWDCHGLPIEYAVTKSLKEKAKDISSQKLRELCRQEASKWVDIQRDGLRRLGVLADWESPYLTMAPGYEADEVRVLADILERGLLYSGTKPVHWCWALQTALAEAEIVYAPHKSPSIYVKFPMEEAAKKLGFTKGPSYALIWTTTPWTLPSNFGIALRAEYEYEWFETEQGDYLFFAREMQEKVEEETGQKLQPTGHRVKGADLENLKAQHPFYERESLFILGDHVTLEAGTGCVHTAPGHGQDDYLVGLKYQLPVFSPVDSKGAFTSEVPEYEGLHVFKANPLILERLKELGLLFFHTELQHSYPHCWRSNTPIIFRSTPQWFLKLDDKTHNVRGAALNAVENEIEFYPEWGQKRLRAMVENRPDWCLSRQRKWGVPLPVLICKKCQTERFLPEDLRRLAQVMETEGGIEAYFEGPISAWAPEAKCGKCGSEDFDKGSDILDVWFDSGVSHTAVQERREGLSNPADLYLEGSDQHRGWFQTSLLSSIAAKGHSPFKALLTHGFVMDAKGRKMSKSQGNVVDPLELSNKNGAEILRLWTAAEDYSSDLNFSQESYTRTTETYRRFRNTMRFLLGNLHAFDPKKDQVPESDLLPLDKWCLGRLADLTESVDKAFDDFEFYKVFHLLNRFFTVELSAIYLDVIKDRLYTFKKAGLERRSCQTVLWHLLNSLTRLLAPIASYLSEETYKYFPGDKEESVFLTDFPAAPASWKNGQIQQDFEVLLALRERVTKDLEALRAQKVCGSSLEAALELRAAGESLDLLRKYSDHLREFFIVSSVDIVEDNNVTEVQIKAGKAEGNKCPRCWHYSTEIDPAAEDKKGVCPKCRVALS